LLETFQKILTSSSDSIAWLKDFSFGEKSNSSSSSSSSCGYWANQKKHFALAMAVLCFVSLRLGKLVVTSFWDNFLSVISRTAQTMHTACFVHIGDLFIWLCCGMGLAEKYHLTLDQPHPPSVIQDNFSTELDSWCKSPCPLSGNKKCPLFGYFCYVRL